MTEAHVIEIVKGGKYVLILPEDAWTGSLALARKRIDEWLASNDPILVAYGVTLKRVDEIGDLDASSG